MKHYDATVVVPTNFVFFTISAILSGRLYPLPMLTKTNNSLKLLPSYQCFPLLCTYLVCAPHSFFLFVVSFRHTANSMKVDIDRQ